MLEERAVKITYDARTDTLTVILKEGVVVAESDEDKPGAILDYDDEGNLLSLEVLDASRRVTDARKIEYQTAVPAQGTEPGPTITTSPAFRPAPSSEYVSDAQTKTISLVGTVPAEVWNRLGTKILPKLRTGSELKIGLECSVTVKADTAEGLATELRQILQELGLAEVVRVE